MCNGLGNTPSLFQTVVSNDAECNHESFYIINFIFPYFKLFFKCILIFIPCMGITLMFRFYFHLSCRRANILMSISDGSGPYLFSSEDGKVAFREGRIGWEDVYFPPELASFPLINNMIKVSFPICTFIWRVNNYVSRQGKV